MNELKLATWLIFSYCKSFHTCKFSLLCLCVFLMVEQYGIFHLILLISIRVTAEITQFTHGLNDCAKLWETIKKHPKLFEKLFTFTSKHHLVTCATMKDLIQVEWSEEGSNRRNDEDATIYCWEIF